MFKVKINETWHGDVEGIEAPNGECHSDLLVLVALTREVVRDPSRGGVLQSLDLLSILIIMEDDFLKFESELLNGELLARNSQTSSNGGAN